MNRLRIALLSASLLWVGTGVARAQQTTTAPAAPAAGTGSSADAPIDAGMDLPLDKPNVVAAKPPTPPQAPPVDPSDVDKPPTFYGHDLKSKNDTIFYVIDISGSMNWDQGQYTTPDGQVATGCRLDRAKAELAKSVATLPSNFKFNMLSFDCDIYVWNSQMVPADDANKQAALGWINSLQAEGATGTGPAVCAALQDRDNMLVVLLTDGGPNCGAGDGHTNPGTCEAHRQMIRQGNTQNAVINVFAIDANEPMLETFCQEVAADNNGTCTDVH